MRLSFCDYQKSDEKNSRSSKRLLRYQVENIGFEPMTPRT